MIIHTLEYIKKEAQLIAGHWNGESERFVDGNGEARTEDEAHAASELLDKIAEVEVLLAELGI